MKYERMKRSSVRCNAVATTDMDVEKILGSMKRARELAVITANNINKKFPSFKGKIRRRIFDDDELRKLSLLFSTFRRETNRAIKSIDSAISELKKGKLPACVKYMKLVIEADKKVTDAFFAIERMPVTSAVISDVKNDLWAAIVPVGLAADVLDKILRENRQLVM